MTETTTQEREVMDRVKENLETGRYFEMVATSHAGRYTDWVVCSSRAWAHCISTLGRMAAEGDRFAQVASRILSAGVPLYQTRHEAAAKVYRAAAAALADGFDDVVGRAAPDAGRFRDHQHPYRLGFRIRLAYYLAEAIAQFSDGTAHVGWAVERLALEERVQFKDLAR